eukprot:CAMPEP_0202964446 /NCGR_PEP_ID=MMETSP1396-20130829/8528_1 /ASSEMBLY_ACC=CAM_ASM_000872 /TAXON_ID= /ORGANISM="Pseudokeronopsis sp., Strain Brazil" /LENGTH=62 /DNA_ID=CAMNT_0049686553 /DNA_START=641 /DNA_END=829 /DNA_ORIENTATION=+
MPIKNKEKYLKNNSSNLEEEEKQRSGSNLNSLDVPSNLHSPTAPVSPYACPQGASKDEGKVL